MFDGRRIVSGSYDNTVKIWDPSLEQPLLHTLVGHTQKIYSLEYDGNYVIR
jgi:F-box/WD-40 domain protein 7